MVVAICYVVARFISPVNLVTGCVTDNNESIMGILAVDARNDHTIRFLSRV